MALYNITEFANLCGVTKGYVSVYKRRSQVIVNEQGLIDDSNPINKIFIDKQKGLALTRTKKPSKTKDEGKSKKLPMERVVKPKAKKVTDKGKMAKAPSVVDETPEEEEDSNGTPDPAVTEIGKATLAKMEQERRKKELDIEKTTREVELLRMQQDKLAGKLIPTDMVKPMVAQHFKSITIAFKQGTDQIVLEFSKRTRMNRNQKAELKGELIRIINQAVEQSLEMTKKDLKSIVEEYSRVKRMN